jgi:hypothetical protein
MIERYEKRQRRRTEIVPGRLCQGGVGSVQLAMPEERALARSRRSQYDHCLFRKLLQGLPEIVKGLAGRLPARSLSLFPLIQ